MPSNLYWYLLCTKAHTENLYIMLLCFGHKVCISYILHMHRIGNGHWGSHKNFRLNKHVNLSHTSQQGAFKFSQSHVKQTLWLIAILQEWQHITCPSGPYILLFIVVFCIVGLLNYVFCSFLLFVLWHCLATRKDNHLVKSTAAAIFGGSLE